MNKTKDLTGMRFGKLTIIKRGTNRVSGNRKRATWVCECDCGEKKTIFATHLIQGRSKSCGCLQREKLIQRNTTHGLSDSRIYQIYADMKDRCYNSNSSCYKEYGGRGIEVCNKWLNSFENFYDWSMANGYKESLTIDRINVNGNYSPDNCRWSEQVEQQNNKRNNHLITYNGETKTLSEWAKELGIDRVTLSARINSYGWSVEKALTTPIDTKKRKKVSI